MEQDLTYMPYQQGDETKIQDLFKLVFGREMSLDYWMWRFKKNPIQLINLELAWHKDLLVGLYATSPVTLSVFGADFLTHLSLSTMTHPDYRGRGVLENLANRCYKSAEFSGSVFNWGFPNANIHYTRNKKLKWVDIYEVPTMRLSLCEKLRLPPEGRNGNIVEIEAFDGRFDAFWDKMKDRHPVLTKRDACYLEWRYFQCPSQKYRVFAFVQGNDVRGYIICKVFESGSEKMTDVVDFLADSNDDVGLQLMHTAMRWSVENDCGAVNMWMNVHHPLHGVLEKLNFQNVAPVTYLGGRLLKDGIPEGPALHKYSNWYLAMGDSDVY